MNHFSYKNQELFIEDVSLSSIAQKVGTPFYCYSKSAIVDNYQIFADAFEGVDCKICYAIKANCNLSIVRTLGELGSGIDVVSRGEIFRAKRAGIDSKKIVFAGVGKTEAEMEYALNEGVEEFSVESEAELELLSKTASSIGKVAKISFRVNPDVEAGTHDKISTGRKGDKFGIDIEYAFALYEKAKDLPGIEIFGIATHIGSQITSLEPFKNAFAKIRQLCLKLNDSGFNIKNLDFGGGVGILYDDENPVIIAEYAKIIKDSIKDLSVSVTIAPGRALVGNAGAMIGEVIYVKRTDHKDFAIIDAAMNDLMRPGLYDSYHKIVQVSEKAGNTERFDIAGPVCETTDILAKNRNLIDPQAGDLLAFYSCGAYGSSMSNEYNSRPLIPEILVEGAKFKTVRKRPSYEEMVQLEE